MPVQGELTPFDKLLDSLSMSVLRVECRIGRSASIEPEI